MAVAKKSVAKKVVKVSHQRGGVEARAARRGRAGAGLWQDSFIFSAEFLKQKRRTRRRRSIRAMFRRPARVRFSLRRSVLDVHCCITMHTRRPRGGDTK